jgi:hypothetical protein
MDNNSGGIKPDALLLLQYKKSKHVIKSLRRARRRRCP